jgi:hypothetical protein
MYSMRRWLDSSISGAVTTRDFDESWQPAKRTLATRIVVIDVKQNFFVIAVPFDDTTFYHKLCHFFSFCNFEAPVGDFCQLIIVVGQGNWANEGLFRKSRNRDLVEGFPVIAIV